MAFAGKIAHTYNNETKSLTFTESLTFMKHKTQKQEDIGDKMTIYKIQCGSLISLILYQGNVGLPKL